MRVVETVVVFIIKASVVDIFRNILGKVWTDISSHLTEQYFRHYHTTSDPLSASYMSPLKSVTVLGFVVPHDKSPLLFCPKYSPERVPIIDPLCYKIKDNVDR